MAICKKRLTRDCEGVTGEMPVACKNWLTRVILNMCRFVQNRVERAVWPRESDSLAGCLSPIRPAATNGGWAAEADLPARLGEE